MKCRCGSDDQLVLKDNSIVREGDSMPHICLGETEPTKFLTNDENEIKPKEEPVKEESPITKYTIQQDKILNEMEIALIDRDPTLKSNVQKLGMKLKIIYYNMPLKMRDNGNL